MWCNYGCWGNVSLAPVEENWFFPVQIPKLLVQIGTNYGTIIGAEKTRFFDVVVPGKLTYRKPMVNFALL